jgi:hypothetical protein
MGSLTMHAGTNEPGIGFSVAKANGFVWQINFTCRWIVDVQLFTSSFKVSSFVY